MIGDLFLSPGQLGAIGFLLRQFFHASGSGAARAVVARRAVVMNAAPVFMLMVLRGVGLLVLKFGIAAVDVWKTVMLMMRKRRKQLYTYGSDQRHTAGEFEPSPSCHGLEDSDSRSRAKSIELTTITGYHWSLGVCFLQKTR